MNTKSVQLHCTKMLLYTKSSGSSDATDLEVIKLFPCSTQLSPRFQLLIKQKYRQMKKFLASSLSDGVFIMLTIVKMPTIVGILTFMSRINFLISTAC